MTALKIIFWVSFAVIFYSYLGYGIVLYGIIAIKRIFKKSTQFPLPASYPAVALIIPAYNEEEFLEAKIRNILDLDYPKDKLSVIFITDGSTDSSNDLVSSFKEFTLLYQRERKGKAAAMNRAVKIVTEPIVVFCDANTILNTQCIFNLVRHYSDPNVGAVAGEKKIFEASKMKASSAGEGLYWRYESLLKKLDSEFNSVIGAAGELFSMRTVLYQELPESTIIEDFVLSLQVCIKGFIVKYEPEAYAMETASKSLKDEQKRKIRISAGAFQAMGLLKVLFNFLKYPVISFQFISHRVLRWTLCPVCLFLIFIVNLLLIISKSDDLYYLTFYLQVFFYLLALIGWIMANKNIRVKALYVPYYFLFMNVSVIIGFKRFLQNEQSVLWEKSARHEFR